MFWIREPLKWDVKTQENLLYSKFKKAANISGSSTVRRHNVFILKPQFVQEKRCKWTVFMLKLTELVVFSYKIILRLLSSHKLFFYFLLFVNNRNFELVAWNCAIKASCWTDLISPILSLSDSIKSFACELLVSWLVFCPAFWYLCLNVLYCVSVISRPTVGEALCVTD